MSTIIKGTSLRQIDLGIKLDGGIKTLPQTTTTTLFTVTGGRILVTSMVGLVTTVVQAQANAAQIVATPTVGTVNNITGTVDINAAAVGSLLSVLGLAADALVLSTGGGISLVRNPFIVAVGTLGFKTAASSTGATSWSITYIPYDDAAVVVAN